MTVPVSEHPAEAEDRLVLVAVWMVLLAIGLFWFYVVMTPIWIGIRLVARISERKARSRELQG